MKRVILSILMIFYFFVSFSQENSKGNFQILTGYETDFFFSPTTRDLNIFNGGFGYKGNLSAIYGKVNYGYLYTETNGNDVDNLQLELDYWQSLTKSKSTTVWLNYAYSWHNIFPNHRAIIEIWQKLPGNFLISGGGVYYNFDELDAKIVNIGLENYFSRYWVEFKTYFYLKEPSVTTSYALSGRVFFKDVNFLQLTLGMGSAQDEPFILASDLDRLNAYSARLNYTTKTLSDGKFELRTGFTYMYEEYDLNAWRNRFAFGIGLIYNLGK